MRLHLDHLSSYNIDEKPTNRLSGFKEIEKQLLTTVSRRLRRRGDKAGRRMRRHRIRCNTKRCEMQICQIFCRSRMACVCVRSKPTWYVVPHRQKGRVPARPVRVSTRFTGRYERSFFSLSFVLTDCNPRSRRARVERVVERPETRLDCLLRCASEVVPTN